MAGQEAPMNYMRRCAEAAMKPLRWLGTHPALFMILFLSFMMRLLLADRNSYWNDELLSVLIYGKSNASSLDVIKLLAGQSVHPPLYQVILFEWMRLFGDTEIATRSLSNLYVTGSTLFLYLFAFKIFGQRVAIASTLAYSFTYVATYYGLETRSYAQTLFLSVLCTYLFSNYTYSLRDDSSWRRIVRNGHGAALLLGNLALLYTHYYNAFFFAVQGGAFFLFLLLKDGPKKTTQSVLKTSAVYVFQAAVFAVTWGAALQRRMNRAEGGKYSVGMPEHNPVEVFLEVVRDINITFHSIDIERLFWFLFAALVVRTLYLLTIKRSNRLSIRQFFILHQVITATGIFFIAYVAFAVAGQERISTRYFVYATPPMVILTVLTCEFGLRLLAGSLKRYFKNTILRFYVRYGIVFATIALVVLFVPKGYYAATKSKHDWRGVAEDISILVRSNPDSRFFILDAGRRDESMLNYYLRRFDKKLRVDLAVTPGEEESKRFRFDKQDKAIQNSDYLVLAFTHIRAIRYPNTLARLDEKYAVHLNALSRDSRGYVVYKINPPVGHDATAH